MRAQIGLVAAVAHRPPLLILDEPSSGLDAMVREDILDAIVRTVSEDGRTVIFSSHLLDEVERMSDHITLIDGGRVVLDGDLTEVVQRHRMSSLLFADSQGSDLQIDGAIGADGEGRAWNVIHETPLEELRVRIANMGGDIVQTRDATLQEVFLARVGRKSLVKGEL